jgi:hypothetical protein
MQKKREEIPTYNPKEEKNNLLICFKQLHTKNVHTHSGPGPLVEDLPPGDFP